MNSQYQELSKGAGIIIAALTFIGTWVYCIAAYGFLFGVGLGWLPSAIVAVVAGFAGYLLWPLILLGIVLLVFALFK